MNLSSVASIPEMSHVIPMLMTVVDQPTDNRGGVRQDPGLGSRGMRREVPQQPAPTPEPATEDSDED